MNKLQFLAILLLFFNYTAFGQFRTGIKGGVNYTNVIRSDNTDKKLQNHYKTGFHAGVDVQIPLTASLYIFTGLTYVNKGARDYNEIDGQTISFSYLELPVDLGYKIPYGDGRLSAGVGLYLAYALSGFVEFAGGKEELKFDPDVPENDPFSRKPFDLGTEAMIGYDFNFGLTFQLKAQLGLMNLMPYVDGLSNTLTEKNYGFRISLGYKLWNF